MKIYLILIFLTFILFVNSTFTYLSNIRSRTFNAYLDQMDMLTSIKTAANSPILLTDTYANVLPGTIRNAGISLAKFSSYLDYDFSFNCSIVSVLTNQITVSFSIMNNTRFLLASIYYIVVSNPIDIYHSIELSNGCN
jgi:hypothetical protein